MTSFIAHHGITAVFVLMAIDAVFPAASELVMLYGGALASGALVHDLDVFGSQRTGAAAFVAIALAGTLGYLGGSLAGWAIGYYGRQPFLDRWGRLVHLDAARLERAERFFQRYEGWAVLVGRVTPVARSFVSIPAGLFEARLARPSPTSPHQLKIRLGAQLRLTGVNECRSANHVDINGVTLWLRQPVYASLCDRARTAHGRTRLCTARLPRGR